MNRENFLRLKNWFSTYSSGITAFSGGVDSALVAYLANTFLGPENHLAVISESQSLKRSDLKLAKDFCQKFKIPLKIIKTEELLNKEYQENPPNRCYFCKSTLYCDLEKIRKEMGFISIFNGQNTDDHGDIRPGIEAAKEKKILSPLDECGLNKNALRSLAQFLDLPVWNKPATPCLASRIPYGEEVSEKKLKQIEAAENFIATLGLPIHRVRHYGELAKIEVEKDKIEQIKISIEVIKKHFQIIGFEKVEIDHEGFSSGKLNRVLNV